MELFEIGRIVRCHGLWGRMKVTSYLESPDIVHDLPELYVGHQGRQISYPLEEVQSKGDFFIIKLRGIDSRQEAERRVGSAVWIPCACLKRLPPGEYYWRDIIGLKVITEEGQLLGEICGIFPTGSNDVYVCREKGREILLPAIEEVVRRVDMGQGIMVVRMMQGLDDSCSVSTS